MISRVVRRFISAGTIQAPPRMVSTIATWVLDNILKSLSEDLRDTTPGQKTLLSQATIDLLSPIRKRPQMGKEFPIRLRDWKYQVRGMGKKWLFLRVELGYLPDGGAEFDRNSVTVTFHTPTLIQFDQLGLEAFTRKVYNNVRHELQHLAQTILEDHTHSEPGLLSRHQRMPDYEVSTWSGEYYLTDSEFHPLLEDAKDELRSLLGKIQSSREKIIRSYVGLIPPIPGVPVNPFLQALASNPSAQQKFRRALKELAQVTV